MRRLLAPLFAMATLLPACASRTPPVSVAPPIVEAPIVAMPPGARAGMAIPPRGPDGRYLTPNRELSAPASLWHVRAALNVAALACRGPDQPAIVAGYNAMLSRDKTTLADAERRYAAEYRDRGAVDWRDRYDDTQTRLYNFWAQAEARDGFCRAAAAVLATGGAPADLAATLALLERPFTQFYAAYEAWQQPPTRPIIALAATPLQQSRAPLPPALPRISVVLEGLSDSIVTHGTRR